MSYIIDQLLTEARKLLVEVSGERGQARQEAADLRAALADEQVRCGELVIALQDLIQIADEARDEWDAAPSGMKAGKLLIALSGHLPGYRADIDAIHARLLAAGLVED